MKARQNSREEFCKNVFSTIAGKYDLLNTVLSFNQDKYWRRFTVRQAGLKPGGMALDVCCGTGRMCMEQAKIVGHTGSVTGVDFCSDMLAVAQKDIVNANYSNIIRLVQANALNLPFPENSFDSATIGFGLRNVADIKTALMEMRRVIKPGGRVVSLDLAKPGIWGFKAIYRFYLEQFVPFLGRLGVGQDTPYRWLPESLKLFPHQEKLCELFREAGLNDPRYYELTGGIVAVHVGTK
ncbi:MAG: Ubiquinone/menaquinone biosynthesis methyltransferase ubiE [Firmicutes bacterium]|nr:Ubiquinone/menaquinone biosynthesis methyltransferase ubiE [Bacillota bacterium]